MADNSCNLDTKIYNTFQNKSAPKTESSAHDATSRLQLVEVGKEVMARGQKSNPVEADAIRDIRKKLNLALPDCNAKLNEESGVFDRELEQRVALFQERHLSKEPGLAGEREVDGVIGKNTLSKLKLVAAGSGKHVKPATSSQGKENTDDSSKMEMSKAEDSEIMKGRQELMRKRAEIDKIMPTKK